MPAADRRGGVIAHDVCGLARESIQLIQKLFRLRTCEDSVYQNRTRPCLLYQIKRCSGPCVGLVSDEDYRASVGQAERFLLGEAEGVMADLQVRMMDHAEKLEYEQAAEIRNQIGSLAKELGEDLGEVVDLGSLSLGAEDAPVVKLIQTMFERVRGTFGDELELCHDVHENIPPIQAVQLAKDVEKYHLFFLEDALAPEDIDYFRIIRQQTSTPLAMGELFVNVNEYLPLVRDRLIDFMRVHISDIGGLTPARKLAALCEFFAVRSAWHGPGDVSPVGHAANTHLDMTIWNFGIQEQNVFSEATRAVFPGAPEITGGYMFANDKPGLGIDIDEEKAAKYPISIPPIEWTQSRWADGTIWTP